MKFNPFRVFACLFFLGCALFFLLILLMAFGEWTIHAMWVLVSGWVTYPSQILPQVSYNFEMIFCGLTALAMATYLSHRLLRWLSTQVNALPNPWKFQYSACLSFLLLSMFGTSIAMTGIIHQTAWLISSDKITHTRGISETGEQKSQGRKLLDGLYLIGRAAEESEGKLPSSLSEALARHSDEYHELDILCHYRGMGPVPWLYPGGGRTVQNDDIFPVLVSPFPNRENQIVVAYSNWGVENFPIEELPPDIAVFFE